MNLTSDEDELQLGLINKTMTPAQKQDGLLSLLSAGACSWGVRNKSMTPRQTGNGLLGLLAPHEAHLQRRAAAGA